MRRRILATALSTMLMLLPMSTALAAGTASRGFDIQPSTCPAPDADIVPVEKKLARLLATPFVPLTQENVAETTDAVLGADILTNEQTVIIQSYQDYMFGSLSADSRDVMDAFQQEAEMLGVLPHEIDERSAEFQIPLTDPRWGAFEIEAQTLFESLPATRQANEQSRFFIFGAVTILAIIACDFKIQACATDVADALEDCVEGRLCDDDECVDKDCCASKAANDIKNCLITCGLNGPDGDYKNCCE